MNTFTLSRLLLLWTAWPTILPERLAGRVFLRNLLPMDVTVPWLVSPELQGYVLIFLGCFSLFIVICVKGIVKTIQRNDLCETLQWGSVCLLCFSGRKIVRYNEDKCYNRGRIYFKGIPENHGIGSDATSQGNTSKAEDRKAVSQQWEGPFIIQLIVRWTRLKWRNAVNRTLPCTRMMCSNARLRWAVHKRSGWTR